MLERKTRKNWAETIKISRKVENKPDQYQDLRWTKNMRILKKAEGGRRMEWKMAEVEVGGGGER